VQANVTILTTAGESPSVRRECDRVDGTKVALDATKLLLKYLVVDADFELACARRSRCHLAGVLATTQDNLQQ